MTERFSANKVGKILRAFLEKNLDTHQRREEFVDGCLQCEKCKLIREVAMSLQNERINLMLFGRPPSRRGRKRAFVRGLHGERILVDDTDMRVRGRTRAGK